MGLFSSIRIGNERYPALTGVRALGAAAVFFVHLPFDLGYKLVIDVISFFFVLSGFLIIYLYYNDLSVKTGKLYRYFLNRFARIYPVYFLLVTIAILLKHDYRPLFLFKNYTLTHALFNNQADRVIQPSWSITVEECFYLLAPVIMYLVRRYNYFISLLFGILLTGIALWISSAPISLLHTYNFVFSVTFFGHFFEFFCGIFLALIILKHEKKDTIFLKGYKWTTLGFFGIALAIGILLFSNNMNDPGRSVQFYLINNFILPVPIATLYYGLICERTWAYRFLSTKIMRLLGRTSYAFYLVHMIIIESLAIPFLLPLAKGCYNLYVLLTFLLVQLIALLIFVFYEEPLNIFIRKKLGPKT